MLLHKSTFSLYLECCVAAAQKHTVNGENRKKSRKKLWTHMDMSRAQKVWICLLLNLGKGWGNKKVHRVMGVEWRWLMHLGWQD